MTATSDHFQGLFERGALMGLSIATFDRDGISTYVYGETGRGSVNEATRFPIASCTKPLTASAVCGLAEAGALDLDLPICTWLPDFRLHDASASAAMTPRDLLCHRSGLPPHTWSWVYGELDRARFIHERLPHLASVGPFREKYRYSNILYAVAGQLVHAVTGVSWEDHMREQVFAQYGMDHTDHLDEYWMAGEHIALPHRNRQAIPGFAAKAHHPIAPASELISTAVDLAGWLRAHMRDPVFKGMTEAQVCIDPREQKCGVLGPLHYGLGWRLDTIDGQPHAWHSGLCSGYTAWMSVMPDRERGIVLLTNSDHSLGWLKRMAYGFLLPDIDWTETFAHAASQAEPAPADEPAPASLDRDGHYVHPGYGTFVIDGAMGWFQGRGPFPLTNVQADRVQFRLPEYSPTFNITFGDGQVAIDFEPQLAPIQFERQRV
jgi:CubicO group peptidase (beta-lactamase class C family)